MSRNLARRGGAGRYIRTPASIDRDLRAANMRNDGKTWQEISDALGYGSRTNVRVAVEKLMAARITETEGTLREMRALALAKLQLAEMAVWDVLDRRHVTVSNGRVIHVGDVPLLDDGPVLAAVDRLNSLVDRQAKLTPGMYAPTQIEAQVTTVDPAQVEWQEHVAEQRALRRAAREQEETQPDDPAPGSAAG